MKKEDNALMFDNQIGQIIAQNGTEEDKHKIKFVKKFIKEKLNVKEFDNSYIEIERMHSKSLMWLLVSLLIDYESIKLSGHETEKRKNYLSLEMKDLFPVEDMSIEEVDFIKHCLEKINVDIETEDDEEFILNGRQFLFLLIGIMKEYNVFLTNGRKFEV